MSRNAPGHTDLMVCQESIEAWLEANPLPEEKCPFSDPGFKMSVDEPCQVCGMLGFDWPNIADKCVG